MVNRKNNAMRKIFMSVSVLSLVACSEVSQVLFESEENVRIPANPPAVSAFKEITVDYAHIAAEGRFPFTGGAAIDIDGDGRMEIFVSGSKYQSNALLRYQDSKLINITEQTGLGSDEASYGATSIDIDNDGDIDLLVAQYSGVWLYSNDGSGKFAGRKLEYDAPENAFPVSIGITDLNKNTLPDLYISYFVAPDHFVAATFNDPDHAKKM